MLLKYIFQLFCVNFCINISAGLMYQWTITSPNYASLNKRLVGHEILPAIAFNGKKFFLPTQCAALCLVTKGCVSFNHNAQTAVCELNDETHSTASADVLDTNGWRYYMSSSFAISQVNYVQHNILPFIFTP